MDLEFTPEQEMLRDTVRRWLDEHAPVSYARTRLEADRPAPASVWQGLADLGTTGVLVPPTAGGSGPSMTDAGVVCEELGRAVHPGPYLAAAVGAARLLDRLESRDLLGAVASGEWTATMAVHEPDRRYDWSYPTTTASAGGSLTGSKAAVLAGDDVDGLLVVASVGGGETGVFLVDPSDDRVDVIADDGVDATRPTAVVHLDGCAGQRLDHGADVEAAVHVAVEAVTLGLVLDGLGAATRALELARGYALERHQFGQPIGSFQALAHLLVDMATDVELTRAGAYFALWATDAADAGALDPIERTRAVALAKAQASAALPRVGASAIQAFGGIGFTWEHDVHLFYKRMLSAARLFGDERHHLEALARLVIDHTGPGA